MFALYFFQPSHGPDGTWYLSGSYACRATLNAAARNRRQMASAYDVHVDLRALPGQGIGKMVPHEQMPVGVRLPTA